MIRFLDIVLSLVAIIILTPFMIPIIIGLLLTGEHHVFYKQVRIGREGKEFGLLKFATMLENSPNLPGGMHTLKDDPRLLPMGRFLRKTKINELPQLLNVLKGDMSIIGYRPTIHRTYEGWPDWAKKNLYDAKPGLSGIGSIVFRNEEEILQRQEDKHTYYHEHIEPYKLQLENWYQSNKNLLLYFNLIFLTVDAVIGGHKWQKILKGLPDPPADLVDLL